MQNPDRFTQVGQAVIGKCLRVHITRRWLLPAIILIVTMGIGITRSTWVAQAQDGGTGSGQVLTVQPVLDVNTSNLNRDRLCIGDRRSLRVTIRMQAALPTVDGGIGNVTIRGATISTSVGDPSVVEVQPSAGSPNISPNAPFETQVDIRGLAAGSTTIRVSATVANSTSQPSSRSVTVHVVPCTYRLDVISIWDTTVYGSANALMSLNIIDARLSSRDGVRFENQSSNRPQLRFDTTVNRIRGCPLGNWTSYGNAPDIDAEIIDNEIFINIHYQELPLGDLSTPYDTYYYGICPITVPPLCEAHPDGICHVYQGVDRIVPQELVSISLPIEGGTTRPNHILNYTEQSPIGSVPIDGGANVTLTPILP